MQVGSFSLGQIGRSAGSTIVAVNDECLVEKGYNRCVCACVCVCVGVELVRQGRGRRVDVGASRSREHRRRIIAAPVPERRPEQLRSRWPTAARRRGSRRRRAPSRRAHGAHPARRALAAPRANRLAPAETRAPTRVGRAQGYMEPDPRGEQAGECAPPARRSAAPPLFGPDRARAQSARRPTARRTPTCSSSAPKGRASRR